MSWLNDCDFFFFWHRIENHPELAGGYHYEVFFEADITGENPGALETGTLVLD